MMSALGLTNEYTGLFITAVGRIRDGPGGCRNRRMAFHSEEAMEPVFLCQALEQNRAGAHSWRGQAARALSHDREDLARRALARQIEHDDLVSELNYEK